MFSVRQKRQIANAIQKILRDTNHYDLFIALVFIVLGFFVIFYIGSDTGMVLSGIGGFWLGRIFAGKK